ncbi:DUF1638 domain-containing protein [Emergencia timonensis]|uniref:DUF1638 domain-containing protein n=1 Tax=Emergencia timonensis TaxID=1776384 RepID=UPI00399191AF
MAGIIMTCSSLRRHVDAAQKKENTAYEVYELDSRLHAEPKEMRAAVFEAMENLPEQVDTVLLSMGLCGGSVSERPLPVRVVMPKVDDCITLLMHTDEKWHPNLKRSGHMYLTDTVDSDLSIINIRNRLVERYGEKKGLMVFDIWFESYKSVDIIDTGVYDCYSGDYVTRAKANADLIQCPICYVEGSNLLLEKLVSGRWDHQFLIGEAGDTFREEDFVL